ncbi:MAG: NADP-dependent oxidoreductase, partial [Bacteroidota bacterium]
MRAIVRQKAAKNLSGMKVMELDVPRMGPQQLTIKMASARINPVDIDLMKGMPFLKYKKPQIGGIDGAGTILDMGSEVNGFQIGDEVFFYRAFTDIGTWAEQIVIDAQYVASIPQSLNLIQAGGIALPLLTAYESLIQMEPKRGESILIHAGAGGVGYQATQIALGMGLKVIATASDQDFGLLRGLGVEALIDYRSQDFSQILANQP